MTNNEDVKTGFIFGTSLLTSMLFSGYQKKIVKTPYGTVTVSTPADSNTVFLQRHGQDLVPPHMINHKANILALRELGVSRIIAINSCGSLKNEFRPGSFLIPDDFICLWEIPTYFDKEMKFTIPGLDTALRELLLKTCSELGIGCHSGGTYIQTKGPRFETKAEIRMLNGYGDIVGMTMASEATLSMEQQIAYASLCSIDNYCNGVAGSPLTLKEMTDNTRESLCAIENLITTLMSRGIR